MLEKIQFLLSMQIIGLCILGGIMMLLRSFGNRARHILGWSMIMWALMAVIRNIVNFYLHEAKEAFHLRYNSDCRGAMPFRPLLESGNPGTAQIPVTLPTWDEVIGRDVKAEDFNGWLLNRILRDKGMPVYTIHAEVEGCAYQHNFVDLLKRAAQEGVTFCPLSELLSGTLPLGQVVRGNIAGREGWLGCQQIAGSR